MANENFAVTISNLLDEYNQEVRDATIQAAKEAAEVTARTLQSTSPKKAKGKGRGKYARGWTVKRQSMGHLVSYVVYNKTSPGLTHTLEHGHVSRNQYGSYGRVRAIPHIGRAADAGIMRFELGVRARLNRGR